MFDRMLSDVVNPELVRRTKRNGVVGKAAQIRKRGCWSEVRLGLDVGDVSDVEGQFGLELDVEK